MANDERAQALRCMTSDRNIILRAIALVENGGETFRAIPAGEARRVGEAHMVRQGSQCLTLAVELLRAHVELIDARIAAARGAMSPVLFPAPHEEEG